MKSLIPAYIYGLRATDSDCYFYVGSTKYSVAARFAEHLRDTKADRCPNRHLSSKIRQLEGRIAVDVLCETNQAERFTQEEQWIARLLSESHPLCNLQMRPTIYEHQDLEIEGRKQVKRVFGYLLNPNRPKATNPNQHDLELSDLFERLAMRTVRKAMLRFPSEFIASFTHNAQA